MAQIEDALVVRMEASLAKFERQLQQGQKAAAGAAGDIERRFANTNRKLAQSSHDAAKGLSRVINIGGQGRFVLQNTAAQFGDIAVQLEQGTAATRVLGQQLPQILGGFGALGGALGVVAPLLGTVAAVGLPLAGMFFALGGDAEEAADKVQTFEEKLDAARSALERADAAARTASQGGLEELKERYGEVTTAVMELAAELAGIERRAASLEVRKAVGDIFQGDFRKQIDALFGDVGAAFVEGNQQQAEALRREIEALQAEIDAMSTVNMAPNPGQLAALQQMQEQYAILTQNLAEAGSLASEIAVDPATLQSIRDLEQAAKQALAEDNFEGFSNILRDLRGELEAAGLEASNGLVVALVEAEDVARQAANRLSDAEVNAGGVAAAAGGIVGPVGAAADEAARLSGNLAAAMANLARVTAGMAAAQRRAANTARLRTQFAGDPVGLAEATTRAELNEVTGRAAYEAIRTGNSAGIDALSDASRQTDQLAAGAADVARLEQQAEAAEDAAREAAREAARAAGGGKGRAGGKGRSGGKSGGSKEKTETPFFETVEGEIQGLQRRIEMIGKTRSEVAELEARYRLLDEAKERGLDLDQRQADTGETLAEQIDRQAAAVGNLTAKYEQAEERAQFFDSVQTQLKDGLLDAIVAGEDFAGVLANVAQMLAKAALQAALFGDGPFGGGGGLFSSLLGGIFGSPGGNVVGNASGTNNWRGGLTRINEYGGEIVNLPMGAQIIPSDLSRRMADQSARGGGVMDVRVSVDENGNLKAYVVREGRQQAASAVAAYDRQMPGRVKQIQKDPRAR